MAEVSVARFQDEEVRKFLRDLDKRTKDIEGGRGKVARMLGAIVYRDIIDHFEKEEGPDGDWAPWSDKYARFMERIGKSGNFILRDTGKMYNTMTPIKTGGNFKKTSAGFLWFNPLPYSGAHEYGSKAKNIPSRSFMWLSDLAMREIEDQTLKFMLDEGV